MTNDLIRNEISAVRTLRSAVIRYGDELKSATQFAQREMGRAHNRAQDALAQRRAALARADRELEHARTALARCTEGRESLEQRVRVATQWQNEATRAHRSAQQAERMIAEAESTFLRVAHQIGRSVEDNASITASTLAVLDARLSALSAHTGRALKGLAVGAVTFAEVTGMGLSVGRMTGNVTQAFGLDTGIADHSITEVIAHDREDAEGHVAEGIAERMEKKIEENIVDRQTHGDRS